MSGNPAPSSFICSLTQPSSLNFQNSSKSDWRGGNYRQQELGHPSIQKLWLCVAYLIFYLKRADLGTSDGNYRQDAMCLPSGFRCLSTEGNKTSTPVTITARLLA